MNEVHTADSFSSVHSVEFGNLMKEKEEEDSYQTWKEYLAGKAISSNHTNTTIKLTFG